MRCIPYYLREDKMEAKEVKKEISEQEKKESKQLLDELTKTHAVTGATIKLNRKKLEVNVYRHTAAVQALEQELSQTSDAISKAKGKKKVDQAVIGHLEKRQQFCEIELEKHEADRIVGVMIPLTYRDICDIKAAVTEAVMHFQKYNFEPEVQMVRIAAEEQLMTVFCALRKKDKLSQNFFADLEEIAMADDMTITDLYAKWEKHFLLTDTEIKN